MGRINEFLVFLSVLIIAFGWRRLPSIGGNLKKSLGAFKKGLNEEEDPRPSRDVQGYQELNAEKKTK
jgi:Sec-independent protein translocase protein TatA